MKIEKAYSNDCKEVIDAELAYDYFWSGKIFDKRNFECPSEFCDAKITCANIDRLRQDMKVDPYYKSIGEHSSECSLKKDIINKIKDTNSKKDSSLNSKANKSDGTADIFILERPKSHWEKNKTYNLTSNLSDRNIQKRSIKRKARENYFSPSRYFSVLSLVSKFFKLKKSDKLKNSYININRFEISYNEMFIEIQGQDLLALPEYPRIFYGKAFVNKLKNHDFIINFANKLKYMGSQIRPSLYVSQNQIEESFSKKIKKNKFEQLSKTNYPAVWVFIYGKPFIKEKGSKTFINLNLKNMDFFDFREKV